MPWKIFIIKTLCLYFHPCLSTGSKEIFIKKREIFFIDALPKFLIQQKLTAVLKT